ncbi:MAG: hypothetical protein JWR16_480 [Nevskia sp.]|nr:hypothetical protein [Nevskia sp.]
MLQDILRALVLVFVIEGILPFVLPSRSRLLFARLAQLDERAVRVLGLTSMLGGVISLQLLRWFA